MNNDGHDTDVTYAGQWLDSFLSTRLLTFPQGTMVVITWYGANSTNMGYVAVLMLEILLDEYTSSANQYVRCFLSRLNWMAFFEMFHIILTCNLLLNISN